MGSRILLISTLVLIFLGLVMVYSSSGVTAHMSLGDSFFYLKRQAIYIGMGLILFIFVQYIDTNFYRKYAYVFYWVGIALLVLVLVPGIGKSAGGAARWISLGVIRLQAGEVFKFALIVYLAMSLAKKGERMSSFRVGIIPHVVLPGFAMVLLLLEPDFGTTSIVAFVTFMMLFVGGARVAYLFGGILFAIPIGIQAIASSPYRMARVMAFLDPWTHRQDGGYQVVQSLMTFGSGSWFGAGLGRGPSKLYFLPAAHTDFILAAIGEELGFLGILLVIGCFGAILIVGLLTALRAKNSFDCYLAAGMTALMILQAILNMFVVMGLVPTKGLTLPLVSYGGSSMLVGCLMMGILYQLSSKYER
ncbi:MAG: putative lipid II flippase FtsW [Myxococcaceae bacterium]|nr:putative lipid II flippase FtsW [Myxococcaceae bacterium]MBH2006574.1 putative lipid II flippase FtsW [Myxococcaceae bacterium]